MSSSLNIVTCYALIAFLNLVYVGSTSCDQCSCFVVWAIMASWTLEDILKELGDVSSLLKHKKVTNPGEESQLEQNMMRGINNKLSALTITAAMALRIYQLLETLDGLSKQVLLDSKSQIDQQVCAVPTQATVAHGHVIKPQTINIAPYLTKEDWNVLQTHSSYHHKVGVIVKKLRALGLHSMSEKTVKQACAALLCTYKNLPEPAAIWQIVQDLKLGFMSTAAEAGLPWVLVYPDDPTQLPKEILENVYKDQEAAKYIPSMFAMVLVQVPLRKTNKLLKSSQMAVLPQPAGSSSSQALVPQPQEAAQPAMQPMEMMATMFSQMMGMMQAANTQTKKAKEEEEPPLKMSPKRLKVDPSAAQAVMPPQLRAQASLSLPCVEQAAIEDATANDETQEGNTQTTTHAIEDATFKALKAKQQASKSTPKVKATPKTAASKKAAAKPKAKQAPKAKAKGQAKAKAKAASAPSSGSHGGIAVENYQPGIPEEVWKPRTFDSWVSKHYHTCRHMALNQGYSDDEAKEFGKKARAKAKAIWLEHM